MHRSTTLASLALIAATAGAALAGVQTLTTERVVQGLARPVFVTHAPHDPTRLFILEQRGSEGVATRGSIRILDLTTGTLLPEPFLRVNDVTTASEQGLLGLAFHPDYENNGYLYVNYTTSDDNNDDITVIERYQVSADPNLADASTAQRVLSFGQPYANHNGGWMAFGPDGYLYISTGDGGAGGDPFDNGQDLGTLLGKLLRLDVDGDDFPADNNANYAIPADNPFVGVGGATPEIWAYGLRNAWRCSFDRLTGDLYIADVGQNLWEEINFQPGNSAGGENYGWRCYEGDATYNTAGCDPADTMVFPFLVYAHRTQDIVPPTNSTGCSITGGYVYRGCAMPWLDGTYFFTDYCADNLYTLRYDGVSISDFADRTGELAPGSGLDIDSVTSFGEDYFGELYIVDLDDGEVFKIIPTMPGPDCDNDGISDACALAYGLAQDWDSSGVPDSCEYGPYCLGDSNCDGAINWRDIDFFVAAQNNNFAAWNNLFAPDDPSCSFGNSDVNEDATVNWRDIDPFVALQNTTCP